VGATLVSNRTIRYGYIRGGTPRKWAKPMNLVV
jgi:hypothetical protein